MTCSSSMLVPDTALHDCTRSEFVLPRSYVMCHKCSSYQRVW
jgi:hypothetical protein